MADLIPQGVQTHIQALNLLAKNLHLSSPPLSKNLPKDDWIPLGKIGEYWLIHIKWIN